MLDQIKQTIEQVSSQEANQTNGIPADLTSKVSQETGNSIVSGLKDSLSSGNVSQLTDLFGTTGSSLTSNPIVKGMITNLVSSLTSKLGIDSSIATNFAGSTIPKILENLISKTKDGSSGFKVTDLITSLSSGSGGLLGSLGSSLGSGENIDGKEGLGGITSKLKDLF